MNYLMFNNFQHYLFKSIIHHQLYLIDHIQYLLNYNSKISITISNVDPPLIHQID